MDDFSVRCEVFIAMLQLCVAGGYRCDVFEDSDDGLVKD
jgi:hypothetical protein